MPDFRTAIQEALLGLDSLPFREGALRLLATLGYQSERRLPVDETSPAAFLTLLRESAPDSRFDEAKALVGDWRTATLLFQLTGSELAQGNQLFPETTVAPGLLQSYLFFGIELEGERYSRGQLTEVARQINRAFPMPVMVLIRHLAEGEPVLSVAVVNRRSNRRQLERDVLSKVTIIRDVSLAKPHRGHLEIFNSFARPNLTHPDRRPIDSFDTLHGAWEQVFNVELLNQRFYRELANWYFWALGEVGFPDDVEGTDEARRATSLIRLLTRLIFCWFLREKGLIPPRLFSSSDLNEVLVDLEPESSTYYQAILQNLFFATLNQRMGKDANGRPYRSFALDEGFPKNRATYGVDTLYRYEAMFKEPESALSHFEGIPFLNGGLFECLDRIEEGTDRKLYVDGFSRNPKKRPSVPNELFFGDERQVDLSEYYGEATRRNERARGLLRILDSYKFTIVENTPIDQEIALDPELLGKVFENLLASYNEETKTTARKQTGSFYTPRPLVDYMVDEALRAHLGSALVAGGMDPQTVESGLDRLLAYTSEEHGIPDRFARYLLDAIHRCRILDPACGSGAFPMGMLHKLVFIIGKLDPENAQWKQIQIDAAGGIPDSEHRRAAIGAIEDDFAKDQGDYGRKLYLIENCLYGVDIQPIAIQISKLRVFISLICDQRSNRNKRDNHGIRPLPNLETKFVAADSLIRLAKWDQGALIAPRVEIIEKELEQLYHDHFSVQRRDQKLALQRKARDLRAEMTRSLAGSFMSTAKAEQVAAWDPFNPQAAAPFFDSHWMFGRSLADGFDIVIGNPPYVQIQKYSAEQKSLWQEQGYETYSAMADIYCLFYERGVQLLRDGGQLCYITSNKWMRAGYGERLREFLASNVSTRSVFDFGMAQNFGAATTYTCIVQLTRAQPGGDTWACYVVDDVAAMDDPKAYFKANRVKQLGMDRDPWVVISRERQAIKSLVEAQGVPLQEWGISIYRGVLTGLNQAFYVTQEQRDAFIAEDPKCADVLVPLVRGRDIERYRLNWDRTWMLFIPWHFPLHEDPEETGASQKAERAFQREYPVVYRYLLQYKEALCKRNRAETGIRYEWYALQRWAAEYHEEFGKAKIMYPNMTKYLPFYLDNDGRHFSNDKGFIVTASNASLEYLTAFLNSSVFRASFRDNFPELMGNTYEVRKIFLEKIPVKKPLGPEVALFEALVPLVQLAKRYENGSVGTFLEELIDACVMECYFREHMAERDLLLHDILAPELSGFDSDAEDTEQLAFIRHLHETLNAPSHQIRNRLLRLTVDSPELLAVIKQEGRV